MNRGAYRILLASAECGIMDVPVPSPLGLLFVTLLVLGLGVALLARLVGGVHLFIGWQEFVSEQASHGQEASGLGA
jgi:hypothetical protein